MAAPPEGHGYIDYAGDEEHFWHIETLWTAALAHPAVTVLIDDLPWRDDGCLILGEPPTWGAFAAHCARAMHADPAYPVIIGPGGDVMDGMHRIVRAIVEGKTHIEAVFLPETPPPDRIRPRPDTH